eukprot:282808-Pelagomonas_calceolata.AAC.1
MTAACAHLHLCISTHAPMGNSGRTPPHSAPAQSSALPAAAEQCGMTHTTAPSCPPRVQASLGLWGSGVHPPGADAYCMNQAVCVCVCVCARACCNLVCDGGQLSGAGTNCKGMCSGERTCRKTDDCANGINGEVTAKLMAAFKKVWQQQELRTVVNDVGGNGGHHHRLKKAHCKRRTHQDVSTQGCMQASLMQRQSKVHNTADWAGCPQSRP